jgi:uncharacterized protein YgbK (DUF1537 family)
MKPARLGTALNRLDKPAGSRFLWAVPNLLVIADDLSGATDVGAQFAKCGIAAFVSLAGRRKPHVGHARCAQPPGQSVSPVGSNLKEILTAHEVVLLDTVSRHLPSGQARSRVAAAVLQGLAAGIRHFYKKTDSTLRGNVGAELEALLEASGQPTVAFIPAHPRLGRTTRSGVHYVGGRPLHESAFAHDPRNPVTESRVATILAQQTRVPITTISTSSLTFFERTPPAGISIFDAETVEDVRAAARAIQQAGCLGAVAGPAAFAECLIDLLPFHRGPARAARFAGPMLVVNGSVHETALRQCAHARLTGFPEARMSPEDLLPKPDGVIGGNKDVIDNARGWLDRGRSFLLTSLQRREDMDEFEGAADRKGVERTQVHERVAANTARIVRQIISTPRSPVPPALVVFGGDTLAAIARELHWSGLIPLGEVLPGMAICEVADSPGTIVLAKPGGFGPDNLIELLNESSTRFSGG